MVTTIAGLEVQTFQLGGGAKAEAAVIFCHGYGAPGDDLVALGPELVRAEPGLSQVRFYFPAAPIALDSEGESRAWWNIDMNALIRLPGATKEEVQAFRNKEPAELPAARAALLELIAAVITSTGLPSSKIFLGGFSQGAMLATDVAFRTPERCGGLAVMSGTLMLEDEWRAFIREREKFPVFQAHGTKDPVLSFQAAVALRDVLREEGATVEFLPFDAGHTIPAHEVQKVAAFIVRKVLS